MDFIKYVENNRADGGARDLHVHLTPQVMSHLQQEWGGQLEEVDVRRLAQEMDLNEFKAAVTVAGWLQNIQEHLATGQSLQGKVGPPKMDLNTCSTFTLPSHKGLLP